MDLTDEEVDYTKITKGLVNMEGLKKLQKKYKDVPYMQKAIKKAMKKGGFKND